MTSQNTVAPPQKPIAISGTIYDPYGAVVTGAEIIARNKIPEVFRTRTDVEGKYQLDLTPGAYEISITSPGFRKLVYSDFQIADSTAATKDFQLVIALPTDHEPCGYAGACFDDEIPEGVTSSPPLVETGIQMRPAPKKPPRLSFSPLHRCCIYDIIPQ